MFNIFRDTIAKDLTKIADYFNGVADAGTIFKDKRALAVNRIKNAVLNGDIGGGGGVTPEIEAEIENAQWKEETSTPLFSETVTTVAEGTENSATLSYAEQITADTIKVTFNGVEYTCTKHSIEDSVDVNYGAPYDPETDGFDFSEYPFNILSSPLGGNAITTETPGTYTISASAETTTYTDAFKKGVAENSTFYVDFEYDIEDTVTSNRTLSEIQEAHKSGANVIGRFEGGLYSLSEYDDVNLFFTFILVSLSEEGRIFFKSLRVSDYNDSTVVDRTSAYIDGTLDSGGSGGET